MGTRHRRRQGIADRSVRGDRGAGETGFPAETRYLSGFGARRGGGRIGRGGGGREAEGRRRARALYARRGQRRAARHAGDRDRKSVVEGKSGYGRLVLGGRRVIKKKKKQKK